MIFAVTLLCAVVLVLLYPFGPQVAFSKPTFVKSSVNDYDVEFHHFEISLSNDSFFPIWCGTSDGKSIEAYHCYPEDTRRFSGYEHLSETPAKSVCVYRGSSRKIAFIVPEEWKGFRIEVDATDWQNQSTRYRTEIHENRRR